MTKLMRHGTNGNTLLSRMQSEMEDVFQRLFGDQIIPDAAWTPSVDVQETDAAVVVKADLPGVEAKDVEVTVQNGTLVLRGEKKEEKGTNYHRVERFSGAFYRAVPLPDDTDPATVAATAAKGVVTVTIPKKPGSQPKRIPVQAKD